MTIDRDQTIKADSGKVRLELIPPEVIEALGEVLTYGAQKYAPNQWKKVKPERYIGALLRHMMAYIKNPQGIDQESGLPHIDHVLCNAAFLSYFNTTKQEEPINDNVQIIR